MGISQLAPIKILTMPRLEINAAIIEVKLRHIMTHEIHLDHSMVDHSMGVNSKVLNSITFSLLIQLSKKRKSSKNLKG